METIYLVIEQGAGITHMAFSSQDKAEIYAKQLSFETGFDCFEVQPLTLNTNID